MRALLLVLAVSSAPSAIGQAFSSGSDGSNGDLNVTANVEIPLPPSGILNYKTVTIGAGTTVTFTRNALNTPVQLLAQGDVVINGIIDVSGANSRPDIPKCAISTSSLSRNPRMYLARRSSRSTVRPVSRSSKSMGMGIRRSRRRTTTSTSL